MPMLARTHRPGHQACDCHHSVRGLPPRRRRDVQLYRKAHKRQARRYEARQVRADIRAEFRAL